MALGFNVGGPIGNVVPDRNIGQTSKPNIHKISFGDGYEQRIQKGINNITESFTISFNNRPNTEIDAIMDFLDTQAGVTKFAFTVPNGTGERTVQVVCEDYSQTYYNTEINSCSATLRRVYEA